MKSSLQLREVPEPQTLLQENRPQLIEGSGAWPWETALKSKGAE